MNPTLAEAVEATTTADAKRGITYLTPTDLLSLPDGTPITVRWPLHAEGANYTLYHHHYTTIDGKSITTPYAGNPFYPNYNASRTLANAGQTPILTTTTWLTPQ